MHNPDELPIVVRSLKITDLPSFVRLRADIEEHSPYMPAGDGERRERMVYTVLKMLLRRESTVTLVVEKGGMLVGYITLIFGRFRKFRGNAYIASVSVSERYRGKGVGTRLLAKAEEYARKRGARRLELEVFSKNKGAYELYERLGWEVEGRKRKAVENIDGFDDLVFMAKFLS